MKRLLITALLLIVATPSFGDTINNFEISATIAPFYSGFPGADFSGTIQMSPTMEVPVSWTIAMPAITSQGASRFNIPAQVLTQSDSSVKVSDPYCPGQPVSPCGSGILGIVFQSSTATLQIFVNGTSLLGFKGSSIVPAAYPVYGGEQTIVYSSYGTGPEIFGPDITSGSVSPVPEPSSLTLGLSGLAALVGVRRKLLRRG